MNMNNQLMKIRANDTGAIIAINISHIVVIWESIAGNTCIKISDNTTFTTNESITDVTEKFRLLANQ